MVRPLTAECSDCGNEFLLSPRGPIPERCHECRRKPAERATPEPEAPLEAAVDAGVTPEDGVMGAWFHARDKPGAVMAGDPEVAVTIDVGPSRVVQGAVFDGHNFDEVRATLDDGVLIDPHREGPPRAEVHGPHRDWFVDVAPGDRVYPDGLVLRS